MYNCITIDGKIIKKAKMSLEDMQKFVGGYIEIVGDTICNEDGLLLKLPVNKFDSRFVGNIIKKVRKAKNANRKN